MATPLVEDSETGEQGLSGDRVLVDMCDGSTLSNPLKQSSRIKYTCIAVGKKYVALGANTGAVYMFDRLSQQHLQVVDSHQPRCEVSKVTFSSDENILCVVSSSGMVSVIEHNTDGHKKSEIIRMSSLHKGSKVTCLVAKETRFFLGDTNGKVTALNGSREFFKLPSEVIMKLDSPIVQLDVHSDLILVSTETRCYLGNTNRQQFTQVGKKLRDIPLGGCFFRPGHMTTPVVYCARPGSRLWEVDQTGSVLNTHMFKQLLDVPPLDAISVESEDHTFHREKPGPQSVAFTTIHNLGGQYLFSICDKGLYILHTSKVMLLLWNETIKRADLTDFAAYKSELYLLYPGNKVCHMTLMSVPKLVKTLFERDNFRLCAQMALAYSESLLEEKTSKKYNINAIMGVTLREHLKGQGHNDLAEKLNPLINKLDGTGLDEWMKELSVNNNMSGERSHDQSNGAGAFNRSDSGIFVMRNRSASFDSSGSFSEADVQDLMDRMQSVENGNQTNNTGENAGKNWNIKEKAQSTLFGIRDKLKQKLSRKESETVQKSESSDKSDTKEKSESNETDQKSEKSGKNETDQESEISSKGEIDHKSETRSKEPIVYYNKNNNSGKVNNLQMCTDETDSGVVGNTTESKASEESTNKSENSEKLVNGLSDILLHAVVETSPDSDVIHGNDVKTVQEQENLASDYVKKTSPRRTLSRKGSGDSLNSQQSQTSQSHHSISSEDITSAPPTAPEPLCNKTSEQKTRSGKKKRASIVSFDEETGKGEGNLPVKPRKEGTRKKKKKSLSKRENSTGSNEDASSVESRGFLTGPASEDSSSLLDGKIASIREDENFIQGDDIDGMTSVHSDKPADVSSAGDCDFLQDVFMIEEVSDKIHSSQGPQTSQTTGEMCQQAHSGEVSLESRQVPNSKEIVTITNMVATSHSTVVESQGVSEEGSYGVLLDGSPMGIVENSENTSVEEQKKHPVNIGSEEIKRKKIEEENLDRRIGSVKEDVDAGCHGNCSPGNDNKVEEKRCEGADCDAHVVSLAQSDFGKSESDIIYVGNSTVEELPNMRRNVTEHSEEFETMIENKGCGEMSTDSGTCLSDNTGDTVTEVGQNCLVESQMQDSDLVEQEKIGESLRKRTESCDINKREIADGLVQSDFENGTVESPGIRETVVSKINSFNGNIKTGPEKDGSVMGGAFRDKNLQLSTSVPEYSNVAEVVVDGIVTDLLQESKLVNEERSQKDEKHNSFANMREDSGTSTVGILSQNSQNQSSKESVQDSSTQEESEEPLSAGLNDERRVSNMPLLESAIVSGSQTSHPQLVQDSQVVGSGENSSVAIKNDNSSASILVSGISQTQSGEDSDDLTEAQSGLLSAVSGDSETENRERERRSRGVSPGRLGRKALESVNTVKDRLSVKALSFMRTLKDTKEWVTSPKDQQPPLDVAPKVQENSEVEETLSEDDSSAADIEREDNGIAMDTSHLLEATRNALDHLEQGKNAETVLNDWVVHLNQATAVLKTLLVGNVIDGRCTHCHKIRKETSLDETMKNSDLNAKPCCDRNQLKDDVFKIENEQESIDSEVTKYIPPRIGDICACDFTSTGSNALVESINGTNFREMCLLSDPFELNEKMLEDVGYLATECFTRGYYGDNLASLKVAKLDQKLTSDNLENLLEFYEEDNMIVFMKSHLYCLDLRRVHNHVVSLGDIHRRMRVWKTLSRCLQVLSYEETEFSGHLMCHNMSEVSSALSDLSRPECMLGCILRLCSENLSIGLEHLSVAVDTGQLTPVDMLYICDIQTSSDKKDTKESQSVKPDLSINKDKGTSVDVREVSEKDDLDSNRKCQGSDSLHRLLKSFTLTQIGKKEGQLDRLRILDELCDDSEVYLSVLRSFLDQGKPSGDVTCVCGKLPRPQAHRLPWLHSHVILDLLQLHKELDNRKCELCCDYGFWLGLLSIQSQSRPEITTSTHALAVAMQLDDPQLLVSRQFGILPISEHGAVKILKMKATQHGCHGNKSAIAVATHSKVEDNYDLTVSVQQERLESSRKHQLSKPVRTGSKLEQTCLDWFDSDEEENECPAFILSDNQRNSIDSQENVHDTSESEEIVDRKFENKNFCLYCNQEVLPCKPEVKDDFLNRLNSSAPMEVELGQNGSHTSHMTLLDLGQGQAVSKFPLSTTFSHTDSWLSLFDNNKVNDNMKLQESIKHEVDIDTGKNKIQKEMTSQEVGISWEVLLDILVQQFGMEKAFSLVQCVNLPLGALPVSFYLRCLVEEATAIQNGKFFQTEVAEIEALLWGDKELHTSTA